MVHRERQGKKIHDPTNRFRLIAAWLAPAQMLLDDASIGAVERAKGMGFHLIEDGLVVGPGGGTMTWRLICGRTAQVTGTSSVIR